MQSENSKHEGTNADWEAMNRGHLITSLQPVIRARVRRQMVRLGADLNDINDLTQEVCLALLTNDAQVLRNWDRARGLSLPNFVGLIAERQAARLIIRQRRIHQNLEDFRSGAQVASCRGVPDPEIVVIWRETLGQLNQSLSEQLTALGVQCFERLLIERSSVDSVCAETGLSRAAVYAWSSRLRAKLRKLGRHVQCNW